MIIDINMHALPENLFQDEALLELFLRTVPQAYGEVARLITVQGTDKKQIVIEKPRGYANLNFSQNTVDVKARLEIMEKAGLDKAILRAPCWQEWLTLEMCHQVNDSMVKAVNQHPDKFLALATIQRFALYYLRDVIEVADPAEAVFRFSILGVIGMLVVVYPAGRISDKMGRKPIAFSSAVLGSLGILVIILYQSYISIMIAAGILGVATGAFSSTNWALATDLVAKGKEARYLGLANMATAGAGVLAGFVGPLIDHYEEVTVGLGYQIMLVACLLFFVLGGLLLLKVKSSVNQ